MVAGAGGGCDIIPKRKFTSPIVCQVCIFLNFVKYDFQDLVKTKKAGQMIPKVFGLKIIGHNITHSHHIKSSGSPQEYINIETKNVELSLAFKTKYTSLSPPPSLISHYLILISETQTNHHADQPAGRRGGGRLLHLQ